MESFNQTEIDSIVRKLNNSLDTWFSRTKKLDMNAINNNARSLFVTLIEDLIKSKRHWHYLNKTRLKYWLSRYSITVSPTQKYVQSIAIFPSDTMIAEILDEERYHSRLTDTGYNLAGYWQNVLLDVASICKFFDSADYQTLAGHRVINPEEDLHHKSGEEIVEEDLAAKFESFKTRIQNISFS